MRKSRFTNGCKPTQEEVRYLLEYQLAYHGGGSRKFEISQEICEDAIKGSKIDLRPFQEI